MELYQLRYFAYAAKYENITMAAQELNVSQPSISKAIQSLERELKTELLRKNGRSCVLTRDGYLLQERVVPLLEEIERLPLEFHNRQKKKLIRLRIPGGKSGCFFSGIRSQRGNEVGCLHSKYTASVCVQQCSKIDGRAIVSRVS